MKTKLSFVLSLMFLINLSFGQVEKQWLIWNTSGKDGSLAWPNNFVSPITTKFTLMGITTPDRVNIPKAKNDIFVIYADGQHFNSRLMNNPVYFYKLSDFNAAVTDHVFAKDSILKGPAKIQYLYLTNRYEGDDPPEKVRALSNVRGNPTTTYTLSTTPSPMISADHDVVLNKDITVIINYDSLRKFSVESVKGDTIYTLKFDGIQQKGSSNVSYNIDVLNLQPVFGTSVTSLAATYNGPTSIPTGESIPLYPGTDAYGYVNLRKTSTAFPPLANGDPQYYAIFTLLKNSQFVRALAEPIRASHDPNYLEVKSICQANDGSYLVTYHLQFENTSNVQADSLSVEVVFPSQFDLSCLKILKWHVVQACTGRLNLSGNTCTFIFHNRFSIIHLNNNTTSGIGYVEFKVRVKPGSNLEDPGSSLTLGTPIVHFDKLNFPLEEFRDLVVCDEEGVQKPEKPQSPEKSDTLKKNEKEAESSKSVKSGQADDMGHMIYKLPPVGGSFKCYRPVSHDRCKCTKPFNKKGILIAVGVVVVVALFFALRRQK